MTTPSPETSTKPPITVESPPPKPGPVMKQISQDEYDLLIKKASNFDIIEQDAEIATKVVDHFRAKTGRIGERSSTAVPNMPQTSDNTEVEQLRQQIAELNRHVARQEINSFRASHPDMDEVRDDMTALVNRGLPLEEAYRFSKAAKAAAAQKPAQTPPVAPTAETNRNAGEVTVDAQQTEALKKINDPKATPRLDDALEIAFAEAKRQHAEQE